MTRGEKYKVRNTRVTFSIVYVQIFFSSKETFYSKLQKITDKVMIFLPPIVTYGLSSKAA